MRYGMFRLLSVTIFSYSLTSCSIMSLQRAGSVSPAEFKQIIPITTQKSVVIVPILIEGQIKKFLFDTGAQLTLLQRDTTTGFATDVSGASKRSMQLGNEIISELKIGAQTFSNTHAWNGDFIGLKEQIDGFGGILGQSVINKANWLINNPEKTLTMASIDLAPSGFSAIEIIREEGIPQTNINIEGHSYKAVIDTGSSASLSVPPEHPLAAILSSQYVFTTREREIYTLGGLQTVSEKVAVIDSVEIGPLLFEEVTVDIRPSTSLRLGMAFFKDALVYIDNTNSNFKIKTDKSVLSTHH